MKQVPYMILHKKEYQKLAKNITVIIQLDINHYKRP